MKKNPKCVPDLEQGLNTEQIKKGKRNIVEDQTEKSLSLIFRQQIVTLFNGINVLLAVLVFLTGSYKNMLFMGVVILNTVIGIVQEIRSKRMLDRLALLHQPHVKAIRNGSEIQIRVDEIVENDILVLSAGDQIVVDCLVRQGHAEANESLLSGESDAIDKKEGDWLWSGSYLESGTVKAQAMTVADETYAASILKDVKRKKMYPSQLRNSIRMIIRFSTCVLIPLGILLFMKSYGSDGSFSEAILSTVAAVVGMIPEGLVFLTSVALSVGAIKLARQQVLVQELYCIEALARVDTLCLDKTGTITEGKMEVVYCEPLLQVTEDDVKQILANVYGSLDDDNATAQAIRRYADRLPNDVADHTVSFSSARKMCSATFGKETYSIGAYSYLGLPFDQDLSEKIKSLADQGIRVVVLMRHPDTVLALIGLQDIIRPNIQKIVSYFYDQGVDLKVISGDDPLTVSAIAQQAGIQGKAIDMTCVDDVELVMEKYSVFGRVSPEQKKEMVKVLRSKGHVVAMTGDGVNDCMALKEADCSIAMASGSEAAKNVASLVLLENQFMALPSILKEGRRVINNIERTASLFLVKTLFSIGLSILTLTLVSQYPFVPIQLTLISSLATGFPSFVLTLEPNEQRVQGHFLRKVLANAIPGAACVILSVLCLEFVSHFLSIQEAEFSTMSTYIAGFNALWVLVSVCQPMTILRKVLVTTMTVFFVFAIFCFPTFFNLVELSFCQWVYVYINMACLPFLMKFLHEKITNKNLEQKQKQIF